MSESSKPLILAIDDDENVLALVSHYLTKSGYEVVTADLVSKIQGVLDGRVPNLIFTDIMMPEIDGYTLCEKIKSSPEMAYVPVIFLSALDTEVNRQKAFSVGAVDYLSKTFDLKQLSDIVKKHIQTGKVWEKLKKQEETAKPSAYSSNFVKYKEVLLNHPDLSEEAKKKLKDLSPRNLYTHLSSLGFSKVEVAKQISKTLELEYLSIIDPNEILPEILPIIFCRKSKVLAIRWRKETDPVFVLCNPFDEEVIELLSTHPSLPKNPKFLIAEPDTIEALLKIEESGQDKSDQEMAVRISKGEDISGVEIPKLSVLVLNMAVLQRASDIHIDPGESNVVVRFRVDGDMRNAFLMDHSKYTKLVARYKAMADMDIAEKRKPQDGSFEVTVSNRALTIRCATSLTPYGEGIVMRLLEPWSRPKSLEDLGMAPFQAKHMIEFSNMRQGLVLIVGSTGTGKTTTLYSLFSNIDCKKRSLMSVEDPVEYRIPLAKQQQVNEKAGITFEALLKSAVRQDPDILFLGEVRDSFSAKTVLDFASTGHLTLSTMHTGNATSAIFRLERLGIQRSAMADTILGIVAQTLVKKLCDNCKKFSALTHEESRLMAPFARELPTKVARPVGCPRCENTGYSGRTGIYEIIRFYPEISALIRQDAPISEIRKYAKERGDFTIDQHAVEKVKNLEIAPEDIIEDVLADESEYYRSIEGESLSPIQVPAPNLFVSKPSVPEPTVQKPPIPKSAVPPSDLKIKMGSSSAFLEASQPIARHSILIVDDDADTRAILEQLLRVRDYAVTSAVDGVEALDLLEKGKFDIILSDIEMPHLDGMKLMRLKNEMGIQTPVIFFTGKSGPTDEMAGLELGVEDYIKKPVSKEILLLRIERVLKHHFKT
ncbi:MAG: Flp pilus assembly complex ATPase component TadA [Elusimicrobia bacterium]|nr:Flp pilus assembly complex ATPase component TadA [Elusimicrobiota bacterium]